MNTTDFVTMAVCLIWLGMIIGVSAIATPIKFHAPTIDLPTALDVGSVTFGLFIKIEVVVSLLLLALCIARTPLSLVTAIALMLILLLCIQFWWLLPALHQRVQLIIAGTIPKNSIHHFLYAGVELCKMVLLVVMAFILR